MRLAAWLFASDGIRRKPVAAFTLAAAAVALGLTAFGVSKYSRLGPSRANRSGAAPHRVALSPGSATSTTSLGSAERIYAPGRVEGQTPEVELHATVTERVLRIEIEEGDFVQPGQILIRLDDERYRAEEQLAEAGLRLAEARLERLLNGARASEIEAARSVHQARAAEHDGASRTMARMNQLRLAGAASGQSIEDAEVQARTARALMLAAEAQLETLAAPPRADEVASLRAEVAAAEARLQLAQTMRSKTTLVATTAGEILEIRVEPGELAAPGMPLVVMCDTRRLKVRADVEEWDALRVAVGQAATITADGLPHAELEGRVSHVRPRLNQKRLTSDRPGEKLDSRTREIWIELISPPPLVVGLPVDVWIHPAPTSPPTPTPHHAAFTVPRHR
ncbi:HlyD family secretion protein [Candidatus Laterigemmans baculatus]|uniref:HlyD family secretion protein n=1 Tax=Candidatus Laterigemmans baculatus TaxID=2770505 RepID=UPI0013DB78B4|nr:efflux RND transporter periplasmic adaptor subunit [Candidatus Laterigemmans baculatus]